MKEAIMGQMGQSSFDVGKQIRADRFTTMRLPAKSQFSAWKDLISPVLDVEPEGPVAGGFMCKARSYDLGVMHFSSSTLDGMSYRHTMDHVRASGIDHWWLGVLKHGRDVSHGGSREVHASSGTLQLRSYAQPFEGSCSASSRVSLFLSREDFPELSELLDAAGHTAIGGPMGEILKECILSLERHIRTIRVGEISLVAKAIAALVSAAVRPSANAVAEARLPISAARFNLARKYIEDNLASPELGPASLCKTLGVSRRQLYYLFEGHGGVAKFILRRRLAACCKTISDQSDQRLISTIAYSFGFTDAALFSRQFHAEYGFRPSDARGAKLCGHVPKAEAAATFSEWLMPGRAA